MTKKPYNTTELPVFTALEKGISHRDYYGHAFRWSHVLKHAKIGMKILDFGCGHGGLYEMFYRNRYSPARYLGLDIRRQTIETNANNFPKAEFKVEDIVRMSMNYGTDWDIITSFETLEHVGKWRVPQVLDNILKHCNNDTLVFISTPCYDERVGAADNHTYDAGDGRGVSPQELTRDELKLMLADRFEIVGNYGTFASIRDYKCWLTVAEKDVFDKLSSYYDTNLVSNIFAPLVPAYSRNNLWTCKAKL